MNWESLGKNLLKSELKKRGINYEQLHEKLALVGVHEAVGNINRKINRGAFSFSFFLQCAKAIGIQTLRLDELISHENN